MKEGHCARCVPHCRNCSLGPQYPCMLLRIAGFSSAIPVLCWGSAGFTAATSAILVGAWTCWPWSVGLRNPSCDKLVSKLMWRNWNLSRSQSGDAMRCDTCEVHCARVGRVVLEIDSCRSMTHWEISRRWRSSQKWRCFSLYCLYVVIFVVDVVGCGLLPQVEACQRYETEGWKLPQVQRGPTKMHRMPGPKLRINYNNPIRTGDWMWFMCWFLDVVVAECSLFQHKQVHHWLKIVPVCFCCVCVCKWT